MRPYLLYWRRGWWVLLMGCVGNLLGTIGGWILGTIMGILPLLFDNRLVFWLIVGSAGFAFLVALFMALGIMFQSISRRAGLAFEGEATLAWQETSRSVFLRRRGVWAWLMLGVATLGTVLTTLPLILIFGDNDVPFWTSAAVVYLAIGLPWSGWVFTTFAERAREKDIRVARVASVAAT